MAVIGKPVDDGYRTESRELLHFALLVSAYHDTVEVFGKHARGIFGGLAPAYLHVVAAQKQRVAAQLIHAHFEGNAGARGSFGEYHSESFAFKMRVVDAVLLLEFELIRHVEKVDYLFGSKVGKFK